MSQVVLIEKPPRSFGRRGLDTTVPSDPPAHLTLHRGTRTIDGSPWVETTPPRSAVSPLGLIACSLSTFVVVTIGVLTALATLPALVGYRPVAVASASMEPTLSRTDIVVTQRTDGPLAVGTVIDFSVDRSSTRIHRIVEVLPEGYRTKGDGNQTPDSKIVSPENVHGFGVLVVPVVGSVPLWADEGRWLRVIVVLIAFGGTAWLAVPGRYDDLVGRRSRSDRPK